MPVGIFVRHTAQLLLTGLIGRVASTSMPPSTAAAGAEPDLSWQGTLRITSDMTNTSDLGKRRNHGEVTYTDIAPTGLRQVSGATYARPRGRRGR